MKNYLIIIFAFGQSLLAQEVPTIKFISPNLVSGYTDSDNKIFIDLKGDGTEIEEVKVNSDGTYIYKFKTTQEVGKDVKIYAERNGKKSDAILKKVESDSTVLNAMFDSSRILVEEQLKMKNDKLALKNTTLKYKATIYNTNFSIPLARFNFTKGNDESKKGDLILFNSIGAGFGLSAGELTITRDSEGNIIDESFSNTFGAHLGFLFSAGTGEDTKNVFAPTFSLTLLDFQLGLGYELGTISTNQKRTFVTLSYAIPLYKLRKGGYWIWKRTEPLPINDVTDKNRQGR